MNKIISIKMIDQDKLNINGSLFRTDDLKIMFEDNNYYIKNGFDKCLIEEFIFVECKSVLFKVEIINYHAQTESNKKIVEDIFHDNSILDQYYVLNNADKESHHVNEEKLSNTSFLPSKRMFDIPVYQSPVVNADSNNNEKQFIKVSKSPIDDFLK